MFWHDKMNIKREFPREIETWESIWITLNDGTRLSARVWLPVDAAENPVPALLEYLPYRKNDGTAWRDSLRHPYLAGHGYAAVRVDIRGSGDSDGLMLDEYAQQELDDGVEVVNWLAEQPWCNGRVGMFGKSWGGFNALQIAALRPEPLKAIITIASTDDRYADDVHYMGGAMLASEMLPWASTMLCYNACPPDPRVVGGKWREMWLNRLENTPPYVDAWLSHQRRDAFWKHGSVSENYDDIECAVYAVGSWEDGYTNAVPRLLEHLSCPKKGLLGPWSHNFPENSRPEPAIGFLQESLRWWDYWLKDIDTGIMDDPELISWMKGGNGRWVADERWPAPTVSEQAFSFAERQSKRSSLFTGLDSDRWLKFGEEGSDAPDQAADNGRSICYVTGPQTAVEILGQPVVTLTVQVDRPQASVAVRLCELFLDGRSQLVTWGLLNLSHRDSFEHPEHMPINESVTVTVPLNMIGYQLSEGSCWQVAVSENYWPHLWPSPERVMLTVERCDLVLPTRDGAGDRVDYEPFDGPECAEPLEIKAMVEPEKSREVTYHRLPPVGATLRAADGFSLLSFPNELMMGDYATDEFSIFEKEANGWALVYCDRRRDFHFDDIEISVSSESEMTADGENFYLKNFLKCKEGDDVIFERTWEKTIPRDFQ